MHTAVRTHPSPALAPTTPGTLRSGNLRDGAVALHTALTRVGAWLAARHRAAADRAVLAGMSERELRDIGMHAAALARNGEAGWRDDALL